MSSDFELQYLDELRRLLEQITTKVMQLDQTEYIDDETYQIIKQASEAEAKLREKYKIGVRFNLIRTQLSAILEKIAKELGKNTDAKKQAEIDAEKQLKADETVVYVYLFNVNGKVIRTWQQLLTAQALFDHSVNRPIYLQKEHIEKIIRSKPNKDQQGYIEVIVKKQDVLEVGNEKSLQDTQGHPLARIKQGSLQPNNIKMFVHSGKRYQLTRDGILQQLQTDDSASGDGSISQTRGTLLGG